MAKKGGKLFDAVRSKKPRGVCRRSAFGRGRISNGVDEELYRKININDLIIFSIYSVIENKEKCAFERLVKECFALFPKAFSLSNFPKWPDSRRLDRPLRTLRKRKLITGNPKALFSLTKFGKKKAEEVAKIFRQRKLLQL